jgi:hypothetical protein
VTWGIASLALGTAIAYDRRMPCQLSLFGPF